MNRRRPRIAAIAVALPLLCSLPHPCRAQEDAGGGTDGLSRHSVYLELLGQGLLYSINYDYRVTPRLSLRAGVSRWAIDPFFFLAGGLTYTSVPLLANYVTGDGPSHLELGAGIVPAHISIEDTYDFFGTEYDESRIVLLGTTTIAYRMQPPDGGWTFRVGLTPIFSTRGLVVNACLSFGMSF